MTTRTAIGKTIDETDTISNHLIEGDVCYLNELIIEGITLDGIKFRPSDWVDRLCGMLAVFNNQKVSYSPYLRPLVYNDMNCVAVQKSLQQFNPDAFNFIMRFAKDNNLIVADCAKFKQHIEQELHNIE